MDIPDYEDYYFAERKMKVLKDLISPLAAILSVADYSHPELEQTISRLSPMDISRMEIRFKVLFQLLGNKKYKIRNPNDIDFYPNYHSFNELIDFKKVMEILSKSRGTIESLIRKQKISPYDHSVGDKRCFLKKEIILYKHGL